MTTVKKFEDLDCWREARILVRNIYLLVKGEKFLRSYRLVDQLTGAALSVMNNIAEGFDSQSNFEFIRFLKMARRSASEVQSLIYVIRDIDLADTNISNQLNEQTEKCRKLIDGLLAYLRKSVKPV